MKKLFYLPIALMGTIVSAQVGVNNIDPKTTLDVKAKGGAGDTDGLQAPRLTRGELTIKGNTLYGVDQKGALIYITDITSGDISGPRVKIDSVGYYYFDGSVWQKIASGGTEPGIVIGYSALLTGSQVPWPGNNTSTSIDISLGTGALTAWRTDNYTLTVPVGQSGTYIATYSLGLNVNGAISASYLLRGNLLVNGTTAISSCGTVAGGSGFSYSADNYFNVTSSEPLILNEGDVITVKGLTYGTSGTPLGFKLKSLILQKVE
ncbi:hypothetical protein [Chryseobacterium sp. ISL-6]|uniref:hypothetical protein n=1 Tax=Chryseobacterium sp. ISL-6 TaxID=2819143 RepID=UPI001BE7A2F0|nr:hypothetical protein [Chryseobacterium sp. ISL-6]MBT2620588.1 hypothetical protein [Chryseobacterium sp. ISL-6]